MFLSRHLSYFLLLGLFWGLSPSLYKYLTTIHMPASHTIFLTGLGVGAALWVISGVTTRRWPIAPEIWRYGLICAFLMNIPFGLNLLIAAHVPPTELAIIITLSPFFNYAIALLTGWENASPRRLMAIAAGFISTLVLILSREGMLSGNISWWLVGSLAIPLLYCFYNHYAARAWPQAANILHVGATESICSGLLVVPIILLMAPFGATGSPAFAGYGILVLAVIMWIAERIAYFTLIRDKGAVYTVQATYVATPAAVTIAAVFFGGASDYWLWLSLALLMSALWLNNSGPTATPQSA
jgi:drug/metabolite transporter (DMT)-like permease